MQRSGRNSPERERSKYQGPKMRTRLVRARTRGWVSEVLTCRADGASAGVEPVFI